MREEQVIEKVKRDFLKDAARLRQLRDEPGERAADNSSVDDLLADYRWLGKDGNKNDGDSKVEKEKVEPEYGVEVSGGLIRPLTKYGYADPLKGPLEYDSERECLVEMYPGHGGWQPNLGYNYRNSSGEPIYGMFQDKNIAGIIADHNGILRTIWHPNADKDVMAAYDFVHRYKGVSGLENQVQQMDDYFYSRTGKYALTYETETVGPFWVLLD